LFIWLKYPKICISGVLIVTAIANSEHLAFTVHGVEYAFGAHDYATSGVFEVEPRQCPGFKFKKSIFIGTTNLNPTQVREFMEDMACSYYGNMYHLIVKNCNHFCQDVCYKLTGKKIPKWVNRLAQIGNKCLLHLRIVEEVLFERLIYFFFCRFCVQLHTSRVPQDNSGLPRSRRANPGGRKRKEKS